MVNSSKSENSICYDVNSIINIGNLRNCGAHDIATGRKAVKLLEEHGWLMVDIADNNQCNQSEQMKLIRAWRTTLGAAFEQPDNIKENFEKFHLENGISVGYKSDETREFFETRLLERSCDDKKDLTVKSDALAGLLGGFGKVDGGVIVNPDCPSVDNYSETVKALFTVLSELGSIILSILAESMGLDPSCLLDLTDLKSPEEYQLHLLSKQMYKSDESQTPSPLKNGSDNFHKDGAQKNSPAGPKKGLDGETIGDYSSSLLRVCRYGIDSNQFLLRDQDREIAFGAHTDTSFISIGLCSSEPGLEILDKKSYEWVCPENFFMGSADENGDISAYNTTNEEKDGLRSRSKDDDGDGDFRVPVSSTIAVVFLGEFLQVLTGGKFSATPHRVRCLPTNSPSTSTVSSPAGKQGSGHYFHSPLTISSSTHTSPETNNMNSSSNNINNNGNNSHNNSSNNMITGHRCSYYNIHETATSKCKEDSPPHVLNIPAPQMAKNVLPDVLQTPPAKNIPTVSVSASVPVTPSTTTSTSFSTSTTTSTPSITSPSDAVSSRSKPKNVLQRSPLSVIQSVLKKVPFARKFTRSVIEDKISSKQSVSNEKKLGTPKKGSIVLDNDVILRGYHDHAAAENGVDNASNGNNVSNVGGVSSVSNVVPARRHSFHAEGDTTSTRTSAMAMTGVGAGVGAGRVRNHIDTSDNNGTAFVLEKRNRAMSDISVNTNTHNNINTSTSTTTNMYSHMNAIVNLNSSMNVLVKHKCEPLKINPVFASRRKPMYKIESDVTAFSVMDMDRDMNDVTPLPQYCDARKYKMIPTSYRVSCPFIIRGKHSAVINIRSRIYRHINLTALGSNYRVQIEKEDKENMITLPTGENVTSTINNNGNNNNAMQSERGNIDRYGKFVLPDLDGTSMLLIHKLLDMKRKRCAKTHEGSDGDWILSAFPVQPPAAAESDDCDESRLL